METIHNNSSDGGIQSPNSVGPSNNNNSNNASSKRNKPCVQCQKLKVKCERNPSGGPCQRCTSQNKECTYHEVPSKRRKKDPDEFAFNKIGLTDRRLDELEKTLASMRKSLGDYNPSHPPAPTTSRSTTDNGFGTSFGHPLDMLARTAANSHSPELDRFASGNAYPPITPPAQSTPRAAHRSGPLEWHVPTSWTTDIPSIDAVERGWLDLEEAKGLFERFWKHALPSMPVIYFGPQGPNFEQIRREEPILFLSILAAAASTLTIPDMFEKLQKEAISIITFNAVVEGQKTSELLLSLLILTFWPMAPSRFDQLKTYLHCHMCVGMAIDLALQRSQKDTLRHMSSKLFPEEVEPGNRKENFTRPLEKERTWIAVFVVSVGFAVGMRRPQSLDWTPHHTYCCQALTEGSQPADLRLVQIAELLKLSQDVSKTFCYDTKPKKLSDPSVYLTVKGYRQQLEHWRDRNPTLDEFVSIWYHHTNLCLHEVSLHSFHNTEDLRPPFGFNVRAELTPAISDPMVSAAHVDCISKTVYSAQKLLDHIFRLHFRDDGESLIPNLPTAFFARSLYAWITLVRVAAVGNTVCEESSLRIDEYSEKLGQVLDEAASIAHFHTAMKFSWILRILKQCYKHKRGMPIPGKLADCPAQWPRAQATPTTVPAEPEGSASASTSTLPPLENDFLAELDFGTQGTGGIVGVLGDGIDWDALMNDCELWNNIGGGWSDGVLDEQSLK